VYSRNTLSQVNCVFKKVHKNAGHLFLSYHAIVTNTDLWQALHSICSSSWKTTGKVCLQEHKNDRLKKLQNK